MKNSTNGFLFYKSKNEEEEWNSYGLSDGDKGFVKGVNFEELSSVSMLLKKEN